MDIVTEFYLLIPFPAGITATKKNGGGDLKLGVVSSNLSSTFLAS